MALIHAAVGDLFFAERLGRALEHLGHTAQVVDLSQEPPAKTLPSGTVLLLADLEAGEGALAAIRTAAATGVPVLAFGPHMDLALRDAALAAGATQVVAKSKLTTSLPELIASLMKA
jgi:alpha-beta hydrolase superfamily lysophospholipase